MGAIRQFVVRANSGQIFLIFLLAILFYGLIPEEMEILKTIASILLATVVFGWFLILGRSLNENLPEGDQRSDTLFTVSCLYGIFVIAIAAILKSIELDNSWIVFLIVFFISFALSFFYVIYYTSVLFIDNQERFLDRDKLSSEVTFILFITFIFGVLILQSRVQKILGNS